MGAEQEPRILVGFDGSEPAHNALRWAAGIAAETGAGIDVLSAWTVPTPYMMPIVGAPTPPLSIFEDAARARAHAAVEAANLSTDVGTRVVFGHPGWTLVEASSDYDLVVIGRTGRGRLARMLIGSTARLVARRAECPVAIIGDDPGPFTRVSVAVDASENSLGALRWAAETCDSAEITAVFSHDERILDELALDAGFRAMLDHRAADLLGKTVVEAGLADVVRAREVRTGDPRTTIVDATAADELLVLGGIGEGFAAQIIGSLASYAIEHAAGPLVIWRPKP